MTALSPYAEEHRERFESIRPRFRFDPVVTAHSRLGPLGSITLRPNLSIEGWARLAAFPLYAVPEVTMVSMATDVRLLKPTGQIEALVVTEVHRDESWAVGVYPYLHFEEVILWDTETMGWDDSAPGDYDRLMERSILPRFKTAIYTDREGLAAEYDAIASPVDRFQIMALTMMNEGDATDFAPALS